MRIAWRKLRQPGLGPRWWIRFRFAGGMAMRTWAAFSGFALLSAVFSAGCDDKKDDPPQLDAPAAVGAVGSDGSVSVYWSAVQGASSYNVYWSTTQGVDRYSGTKTACAASRCAHSGLANGTAVYYVVTAVKDALESGESSEVSATPSAGTASLGATWSRACSAAPWGGRIDHAAAVFANRMWVIGGSSAADVWNSSDGSNWNLVTSSAAFGARSYPSVLVHGGCMWVLGGSDGTGAEMNDAWRSTDGLTWTLVSAACGFSGRILAAASSADSRMWILGGSSNWTLKSDVWWSADGSSWTMAAAAAPWTGRDYHLSLEFAGKIWVIGGWDGMDLCDVWCSP